MAHLIASGRINDAKKCLMELIEECGANVVGDWGLAMEMVYGPISGLKLPVVTVRISPARVWQVHYARRIPEAGDMGVYAFSAHVFHKRCKLTGEEKYKYTQDLADKIMHYLLTRKWEALTECSICDIYDLQARESQPRKGSKGQQVCRIIIEGFMLIKRIDA